MFDRVAPYCNPSDGSMLTPEVYYKYDAPNHVWHNQQTAVGDFLLQSELQSAILIPTPYIKTLTKF
jgi:hypothetical protein